MPSGRVRATAVDCHWGRSPLVWSQPWPIVKRRPNTGVVSAHRRRLELPTTAKLLYLTYSRYLPRGSLCLTAETRQCT